MPKLKNGSSVIYILFILAVAAGIGLIYYSYQSGKLEVVNLKQFSLNKIVAVDPDTTSWQTFKSDAISFRYPADWFTSGNQVFEYPYNGTATSTSIINLIVAEKVNIQLHAGYVNQDFFNSLYNLKPGQTFTNQWYPSDKSDLEKQDAAQTINGIRYVVYKDKNNHEKVLAAYLNKGDQFYSLTLSYYNSNGEEVFKKLLTTVNF